MCYTLDMRYLDLNNKEEVLVMKKSVKAVLCLSLVAILLVTLVACGGIAGRYDLVTMEAGGQSMDIAALKALTGQEMDMYLELNSDGTGVMKMDGETTEMVYDDSQIWPASDPDDKVAYTVDGDTLTIEQDGVKMVFKK